MDNGSQTRVVQAVPGCRHAVVRPPVRVLAVDPELGRGITAAEFEAAAEACLAPVLGVMRGAMSGWPLRGQPEPGFRGFLVLRGVLSRRVRLGNLAAAEVFGPGDFLRPWPAAADDRLLSQADRWRVHDDAVFAVMDRRFCRRAALWPEVASALLDRETQRLDSLMTRLLIAQTPRITERVHLLLWHLAERWGTVGPEGVRLPLRLSRALLAELACTTRESVSRALKALADQELVESTGHGFLLHEAGPDASFAQKQRHEDRLLALSA